MFFTQEDYKKIQNYLTQHAVRDTDLNNAAIPFDGNEVITIVQNDENKKVLLKDLISQIFDLGIYDFINITDRYDAPNITLEEAISYIPVKARKKGQVITFLNDEDKWQIYQFKGALNQWNILDQWQDLFDWEKLIPKVIAADEVFLTQTEPDEHGTSYLTLKDKRYRPSEYSGLGRVILKKNIVTFEPEIGPAYKRNILYQDMFIQPNTVYEIHYDFDLDGKDIVLPDNSYIEYVGGSITNGNIIDNAGGLKTVILRKNMVGDKNVLTQDMINTPNTIYEIRYDFDLNGAEITIPENCVLKYAGGKLINGGILGGGFISKNGKADWDLLSETCGVNYSLIWDNTVKYNDAIFFDLQNLQGPFKKYSLVCDGTTDNSPKLIGLFKDNLFNMVLRYRKAVLSFTRSMNPTGDFNKESSFYLFKSPVIIDGGDFLNTHLELQIYNDIKADFTDIEGIPTRKDIVNDIKTSYECHLFEFGYFGHISFVGSFGIYGNARRFPRISCGAQSILTNNHYYEGIVTNSGKKVYGSFGNGILVKACGIVECKGIEIDDSFHGLMVAAHLSKIEGVVVTNVIGDNGISVWSSSYHKVGQECGTIVSNCVCKNCKDLGISIQVTNALCINCLCENCGNDFDNSSSDFGVDRTFNSGGGFDAEPYLQYGNHDEVHITFMNCTAKNCYNYGFHTDNENTRLIGCTIDGITSTWRSHFPISSTEFKYQAVGIRKGGALSTSVDATKVGFIVSDCTFKNCTNIVRDGAVRTNLIYNSTFENITANEWNSGKAELIGCKFDDNFDFTAFPDISYHHTVGRPQGTTQQRPNVPVGEKYFDTTLNKPIWWNGTEWVEEDNQAAGIQRAGTWSQRPNADGSFLDNGFQYFLLESTQDTDPEGQPIESLTGNGKPIWWIQSSRKWVDAFGNTITGSLGITKVNEVRHLINGEEYKVLTTDAEGKNMTIYAPIEAGNGSNYILQSNNDGGAPVWADKADLGL